MSYRVFFSELPGTSGALLLDHNGAGDKPASIKRMMQRQPAATQQASRSQPPSTPAQRANNDCAAAQKPRRFASTSELQRSWERSA